jgi:hypothetical protein
VRGARRNLRRREALNETGGWATLPAGEGGWYKRGARRGAEGCLLIGPLPHWPPAHWAPLAGGGQLHSIPAP